MAVTIDLHMPKEAGALYDPINQEMGVDKGNLPDGLIHHFATKTSDGFNIFEVWESREAFERFVSQRLSQALKKLAGEKAPRLQPTLGDLFNEFHR